MGLSQRLRLSDVRGVFRILSDARDLRHDPRQQEKVIVDAMVELLDADFGHAVRYAEFRPHRPTSVKQVVFGSIQDDRVSRYVSEFGRTHDINDDPMKPVTWDKTGPTHTTSRAKDIPFDELKNYKVFEALTEPAKINDAVLTFFRYPRSHDTRGYSFIRTLDKKEFTPRELRITHLLCSELHRLYLEGVLEERSPLDNLPPRLACLAQDLMTGLSQKEIARMRMLSYETVRSYTKELYERLAVSSREGLMAKLLNRTTSKQTFRH